MPSTEAVPISALLSLEKSTVPAGLPAGVVIVAVMVTHWPRVDGLGDDVRVVLVAARLTVCATDEVDPE